MVNYTCDICNFNTKYNKDYQRHINTNKHKTKMIEAPNSYHGPIDPRQSSAKKEENKVIEDICELQKGGIMCIYCNSTFVRSDYLTKHLRYCLNRQIHENKLNEKIKFLENKLTETVKVYELENKHHIEEKEHYKTEMINYKKLLMETGKLVKTSVNALTYVVDNYEDAPAIKQIKFNDLNTKKLGKVKFIEELLSAYKHKILNKFLGDSIIAIYKKNNPEDQSIWNTDTYRLTYLLKELLDNKTSNWIVDKKGNKTIEYVIDPILKNIRKMLLNYNTYASKKKMKPGSVDFEIALENSKAIVKLANEIDDGITSKAVLKYISPKMSIGKNKLKELELESKT